MKQVSNLLKELKNNSNSSGLQTIYASNSGGGPPYDEKSLKL